jgi:hypothetical protein
MGLIIKALAATTILSMFGLALAVTDAADKSLSEIAPYRQWTRVNPKPIAVRFASAGG